MLEGVVKRILTSNSKEFGVFLYKKKPPAMKVECTDFSVSPYKKHRFAILEAATNRDQTERRTLEMKNKANESRLGNTVLFAETGLRFSTLIEDNLL